MCACREYKPILRAAYFTSSDPLVRSKFSLELKQEESKGLCQAFDRKASAAGGGSSFRPQPLPGSSAGPPMQRYMSPHAQRVASACVAFRSSLLPATCSTSQLQGRHTSPAQMAFSSGKRKHNAHRGSVLSHSGPL